MVLRRQRYSGYLGLVAHLGQEEGHQCGAEHAETRQASLFVVDFVRHQNPGAHGDERNAEDPAEGFGAHPSGE